jgi:hypothetical protein
MKRFTRDETEHNKEYYLVSDVDAAQGFMADWANFEEGRMVGRAEALERAWVDLTRQQFLEVTDDLEDLEDCWIQIQAKLKEVNIR